MNNKKGFTLIELLVVIAIIGLLSTMSVLALNSARARARDAKRIADIKQIQTALEMYYNDNNTYPEAAVATTTALVPYLKTWPTAPLPVDGGTSCEGKNDYTYTFYGGSSGTGSATYALSYCLGSATGNVPAGPHTATPAGIY